MPTKKALPVLVPDRVRNPPRSFAWLDHRLRSSGLLALLEPPEIGLYFFLDNSSSGDPVPGDTQFRGPSSGDPVPGTVYLIRPSSGDSLLNSDPPVPPQFRGQFT